MHIKHVVFVVVALLIANTVNGDQNTGMRITDSNVSIPNKLKIEPRKIVNDLKFSKQEIDANLLYSISISNDHKVSFYEFEGGDIGVNETLNIDKHKPILQQLKKSPTKVSDIFRLIKPNTRVPDILIQADQAQATVISDNDDGKADKESVQHLRNLTNCIEDGYWHSWECDAQWFMRNFCSSGAKQYCYDNRAWVWQRRTGKEMNITGMAAGFDTSAHFVIQWKKCGFGGELFDNCSWKTHVDTILPPRTYSHWYFPKHYQRYSKIDVANGEQRIHFAMTYNTESYSSSSTQTPTGEVCKVWARVHAGNCYNADGSVSSITSHKFCADACASTYDNAVQFAKASLISNGLNCDVKADQNFNYCGY